MYTHIYIHVLAGPELLSTLSSRPPVAPPSAGGMLELDLQCLDAIEELSALIWAGSRHHTNNSIDDRLYYTLYIYIHIDRLTFRYADIHI